MVFIEARWENRYKPRFFQGRNKYQLGRRNITSQQRDYLLGLRYRQEKKTQGGDRKSEKSKPQNGDLKTSEKIAQQHGVSKNTVERAEKFADGVDKIAAAMPESISSFNVFGGGMNDRSQGWCFSS